MCSPMPYVALDAMRPAKEATPRKIIVPKSRPPFSRFKPRHSGWDSQTI